MIPFYIPWKHQKTFGFGNKGQKWINIISYLETESWTIALN